MAIPLTVFLCCHAFSGEASGPVVSVLDVDTTKILYYSNKAEHIRLSGIDYPEKGQAYGKKAKQAISDLVVGKEVPYPNPRPRQV